MDNKYFIIFIGTILTYGVIEQGVKMTMPRLDSDASREERADHRKKFCMYFAGAAAAVLAAGYCIAQPLIRSSLMIAGALGLVSVAGESSLLSASKYGETGKFALMLALLLAILFFMSRQEPSKKLGSGKAKSERR